jgi:phosphate transport system protein
MNNAKHITHGYDRQMEAIGQSIRQMGELVISQIELSLIALNNPGDDFIKDAKLRDREINTLEEKIETQVTQLLTTAMPMASDLRLVLSALRIGAELERAGDHAKNIIKRCAKLKQPLPDPALEKFSEMCGDVVRIFRTALEASTAGNTEKAISVWKDDDAIDAKYRELFKLMQDQIRQSPENTESWTHVLFIAKFYERIGDYANEIAKTVHYVQIGTRPRHTAE